MSIEYAPSTESKTGHELINVFVFYDGKRIKSTFQLNEEYSDYVELTLTVMEQHYRAYASTFFRAMSKIRANLELENKYLICYGASEDVYPSGMSVSMGTGRLAYRCKPGTPALRTDIVDIFNADDYCVPATIQAQKRFNEKWLKSISGIRTNKKIRVTTTFNIAFFFSGVGLWGCVGLFRWLTNDEGSEAVWITMVVLGLVAMIVPFLPFFETINKPSKKALKPKNKVLVEEQTIALSELGIKPKQEDFLKWVNDECDIEDIESNPYNALLYIMSGIRQYKYGTYRWEPLSDDIFILDIECVVSEDIYAVALKRLAVLLKGCFDISNVSGKVNHDEKKASVSFSINGKNHSWQLRYDNDRFDVLFISRINSLLKNMGSEKLLYMSVSALSVCVVFSTEEVISRLNGLIALPFYLDIADGDGSQELSYSLRTQNYLYSNNMIYTGLFESIMSASDFAPNDFMVLAPSEPINRSTFLQMAKNSAKKTKYLYTLETAFGKKNRSTSFYRMDTNDKDVVLQHFVDYWRDQKIPDVSLWEDVSGELSRR